MFLHNKIQMKHININVIHVSMEINIQKRQGRTNILANGKQKK